MEVFNVVFFLVMVLSPLVIVQFYRPKPGALGEGAPGEGLQVDMLRVRLLRKRLYLWTGLALVTYFALLGLRLGGQLEWWSALPWYMTFGRAPDQILWIAFFPLWFALAMPLLVASRPEAGSPFADKRGKPSTSRSASLTPRHSETHLPKGAGWWMLALWITGLVLTLVLGLNRSAAVESSDKNLWLVSGLLLMCALVSLTTVRVLNKSLMSEPEPMDAGDSPELSEAYASLRAARARGLFALSLVMEILLLTGAVLSVSITMDGATVGIIGGTIGSLVGLWGAAFGIVMSNRRMRIQRLLTTLQQTDPSPFLP